MWDLKYDTNELIYETKTISQIQRTDFQLSVVGGGRKDWEFGVSRHKLLHTGWIRVRVLLYSIELYSISYGKP